MVRAASSSGGETGEAALDGDHDHAVLNVAGLGGERSRKNDLAQIARRRAPVRGCVARGAPADSCSAASRGWSSFRIARAPGRRKARSPSPPAHRRERRDAVTRVTIPCGGWRLVIQALRGTNDILPEEVAAWRFLEQTTREVFARYGFREIRTPIFEATELFARGVGESTDIVRKEMYTFDAGGRVRDAAAREHRPGRARVRRALAAPDDRRRVPGAPLLHRADVPLRAAAEGAAAAVPPDRGRGARRARAVGRRGDDRDGLARSWTRSGIAIAS